MLILIHFGKCCFGGKLFAFGAARVSQSSLNLVFHEKHAFGVCCDWKQVERVENKPFLSRVHTQCCGCRMLKMAKLWLPNRYDSSCFFLSLSLYRQDKTFSYTVQQPVHSSKKVVLVTKTTSTVTHSSWGGPGFVRWGKLTCAGLVAASKALVEEADGFTGLYKGNVQVLRREYVLWASRAAEHSLVGSEQTNTQTVFLRAVLRNNQTLSHATLRGVETVVFQECFERSGCLVVSKNVSVVTNWL